jgi:hypothetical protein
LLQPINNARTLSGPGFPELDIWLSVTEFHGSQDLGFRTSINGHWVTAAVFLHSGAHIAAFGSQDLGFRTSTNCSGCEFEAASMTAVAARKRTFWSGYHVSLRHHDPQRQNTKPVLPAGSAIELQQNCRPTHGRTDGRNK